MFLERCVIETSPFDLAKASADPVWCALEAKYMHSISSSFLKMNESSIPKTLHFIWVGDRPIDQWYLDNIKDWKNKNPEFEIMIWTEGEMHELIETYYPGDDLFYSTTNVGMRSDIARLLILLVHGGVYVDLDYLCVNPLKDVCSKYDFFAGITLESDPLFNNGLIGAKPGHPVIDLALSHVDPNREVLGTDCEHTKVFYKTGPRLFTSCIMHTLANNPTYLRESILFPAKTFNPFPAVYRNSDTLTMDFISSFFDELTIACHLWHCSWQGETKGYKGEFYAGNAN